jgi:hypothetical protein
VKIDVYTQGVKRNVLLLVLRVMKSVHGTVNILNATNCVMRYVIENHVIAHVLKSWNVVIIVVDFVEKFVLLYVKFAIKEKTNFTV